jgi:RNA polymerase sigma-54 factor
MDFASTLTRLPTLAEHLTDQLHLAVETATERLIGQHLIGIAQRGGLPHRRRCLDGRDAGHHACPCRGRAVKLQQCDPPAFSRATSRNACRCSLREIDRYDPAMAALVDNLELVARRDYNALKSLCRVDIDDLKDMIAELRNLNPKPGHAPSAPSPCSRSSRT